jgi:hypothetical protein
MTDLRSQLASALREDSLACDLMISIFQSAVNSYKHDSVLRPFPPSYAAVGEKDVDSLVYMSFLVVYYDYSITLTYRGQLPIRFRQWILCASVRDWRTMSRMLL